MPYSADKWTTSDGDDRYRRSLYTFWRRTAPFPSFLTFDATSREKCTVRRVRTDTPLQALTLLNDPASFDAAQALARRIIAESPSPSARDRAAYAIKVVLSREAKAEELERIARLFAEERAHYDPIAMPERRLSAAGIRLADLSDRAAWTIVANALLNLDEAVTKM